MWRWVALGAFASGCAGSAPDTRIEPAEPRTGDDLVAIPPPGPDEVFDWTWRRDGVVVEDLRGDRVPAERTARGERWAVEVARVGAGGRSEAAVADVEIGNTAPVVTVSLLPDPPVAGTPLLAAVDAVDPDGDEVSLAYAWSVDGDPVDVDGATVPGDLVRGDQLWVVVVTAADDADRADGTAEGATGNTAPRLASARIEPRAPSETDVLTVDFVGVDADGDPVTVEIAWSVNGLVVSTEPTLSGAYFRRDDVIDALVTPFDGAVHGPAAAAGEVVVTNAVPSASGAAVSPSVLSESALASCSLDGAQDLDGDAVTAEIRWFVDGTQVSSGPTLSGDHFDKGDAVSCEATPFDGSLAGVPLVSVEVEVVNTPPVIDSVTLSPTPPTAAGPVTATYLLFDVDPADVVQAEVDWFIDGNQVTTAPELDGLVRDQIVQARVRGWDGEDPSLTVSSTAVTVANAVPVVTRAAMVPAQPTAADEVLADVAFDDADGDAVTGEVVWTADGAQVHVGPTLPAGTVAAGVLLQFTVTPDDGTDLGAAAASPEVLVGG